MDDMKQIYTSDELWDENEKLQEENELLRIALEMCKVNVKSALRKARSRKAQKKAPISQQTQTLPSESGEPYANRKLALMKLRVHAPRLSKEPGYLPMSKPTLEKERKSQGLSRKQVADRMGVSVGWLTELERGERALFMPVLRNFRRALRMKPQPQKETQP